MAASNSSVKDTLFVAYLGSLMQYFIIPLLSSGIIKEKEIDSVEAELNHLPRDIKQKIIFIGDIKRLEDFERVIIENA
jgi:hypothetical protein